MERTPYKKPGERLDVAAKEPGYFRKRLIMAAAALGIGGAVVANSVNREDSGLMTTLASSDTPERIHHARVENEQTPEESGGGQQ